MEDTERCPNCAGLFDVISLIEHVPQCNGSSGNEGGNDGGNGGNGEMEIETVINLSEDDPVATAAAELGMSKEEYQALLISQEQLMNGSSGGGSSNSNSGNGDGGSSSNGLTADEEFARKLQEEEEQAASQRNCVVCHQRFAIDDLYSMHTCSHFVCRPCGSQWVNEQLVSSVDAVCPKDDCDVRLAKFDFDYFSHEDKQSRGTTTAITMVPQSGTPNATKRINSELKHIFDGNPENDGYEIDLIDDNIYHWEVKFFNFDEKEPLAKDLQKTKDKTITLRVVFPMDYPTHPPYIRVIRPRFAFRTGNITIGGSVCNELLTNTGWSPQNTMESVLLTIRAQMIAGGARLDLRNTHDYTESEAKVAFDRMVATHGW
eukprot:TRINITY_DN2554_c0_g1_i1.p1 TRINITY_DN2554_c0_g1~~TRINITY_DN2554_c0_g1_i1.p1  ORF type:complete len:391 (-),score=105.53 TRINITY_DN2554_c0_g1_i1:236-1357(-)